MAFHKNKLRRPSTVFDIKDVLYATLKVMEDRGGYVSNKSSERTGEAPTSQFVLSYLKEISLSGIGFPEGIKEKFSQKVTDISIHFSQPPEDTNNEFDRKVYELLSVRSVSDRMIAYIVALPSMYENIHNRTSNLLKIAEKYSTSNYIGEIGVSGEFTVKLLDVHDFHKLDDNGVNQILYIYRISDRNGNIGFFFSKDPPADNTESTTIEKLPIKVWDCFQFEAIPKKQSPNRETGIKETQFTKVKIIEVIGQGTEE